MGNKVKEKGGINLAQGLPGFEPPRELLTILKENIDKDVHQYPPANGNAKLVKLLVEKYGNFYPFKNDNFLITQGATEAISLIFIYLYTILEKPFSVLSFDPSYESFRNLPAIFHQEFVPFQLDDTGVIEFAELEKTIIESQAKAIILSTPGNPYGKTFTRDEFYKLIQLSMKYNCFLIIDAVYRDLYYETPTYIPFDKFSDQVFYINSFSKMFSITGWRIGYFIAHENQMKKIRSVHDYIGLCAPSLLQQSIADYMEDYNKGEDYIEAIREKMRSLFFFMRKGLLDIGFDVPKIDGGYFIWCKLPGKYESGFKFAIDLYEKMKVAVVPGIHFSDQAEKYIRINIAREKDELEEALERICDFVK